MGSNSYEMRVAGNPHGLHHLVAQFPREAPDQYITGHSPGKSHHSTVTVGTTDSGILFTMPSPCQPAQSALEHTMSALITPPATHCPFGITQHLPIVRVTTKDICSTRVDRFSVGISNDPTDAWVRDITTNAQAVEMLSDGATLKESVLKGSSQRWLAASS
jgi:hypothetical protein